MDESYAKLYGQLGSPMPSKRRLASILRRAGLAINVGQYAIRVEDCSNFVFEQFGGDLGDPVIDADADTPADLIRDAKLVSEALVDAGIRHRFEIYRGRDEMVEYLHHNWPLNR